MFGGGGSPPSAQKVEPKPKETDPEVQKAQREALERKRRAKGYKSTVLRNNLMSDETAAHLETLGT